jgi:hypothetical protein
MYVSASTCDPLRAAGPPVGSEGVWVFPLAEQDLVTLDNIPWFVRNAAVGDTFQVWADDEGVLWKDKVSWSGNCAIRVIPFRAGPLTGSRQEVLDAFAPLGVDDEGAEQFGMVALNVPPDADIHTQTSRT